jgi:hypothetical protein
MRDIASCRNHSLFAETPGRQFAISYFFPDKGARLSEFSPLIRRRRTATKADKGLCVAASSPSHLRLFNDQ